MHMEVPAAPVGWATENCWSQGYLFYIKPQNSTCFCLSLACVQEGIFDLTDRSREKSPIYSVDAEGLVIPSSAHLDGGLF